MKPRFISIGVLLTFLSSCDSNVAQFVKAYYHTELFKYNLSKQKKEISLNEALLAKEALSDHFITDSNLGVAFSANEKKPQAGKSFQNAVELSKVQSPDPESPKRKLAEFSAYYNQGVFLGASGEIDQAIEAYQAALDRKPDSKEIKHNLELLIQQQQQQQKQDSESKEQSDQGGQGQPQDQKNEDNNENSKDQKDQDQPNEGSKDRKQSGKYQPRPYKGDQLSEGDVKKILGELSQQDKKIRSQFEQKKRNEERNEKDW